MAVLTGILKVSSAQLSSYAGTFENSAIRVQNLTNHMIDTVCEVSEYWKGGASTMYYRKFKALENDMRRMFNMMREHSEDLKQMARNYENAESTNIGKFEILDIDIINVLAAAGAAAAAGGSGSSGQTSKTPAQTKEEYYAGCAERRENAIDDEVARLYDKYKNKIHIGSDTYKDGAYYNPIKNKVYFNWEEDAENPRGAYCTYYHEVGHMIDDYTKWWGDSSSSKSFTKALQSDFDNYVSKIMKENSCDRTKAYEIISDWLWEDADNKNGISDLCGGLSGNKCLGVWGHKDSYWSGKKEYDVPDKVNNEAFAHFFEASMATDDTKLDYIKELFPTAYDEFKKIVRNSSGKEESVIV